MKRLRVLISAYACEPNTGSEPGVGWNLSTQMAKYHNVVVLTRKNNRPAIEKALHHNPVPGLEVAYFDFPDWAKFWKRGARGVQLYYYLWQIGIYFVAKRLHRQRPFDLTHHITFVKYWTPSLLSLLPTPFIWGPIGGGDSTPKAFIREMSFQGQSYETLRNMACTLGEFDPLVKLTAKNSVLTFASTPKTAERLELMGSKNIRLLTQCGLSHSDFVALDSSISPSSRSFRFISIGNLLSLKGFNLGLKGFAQANLSNTEYFIVGSGPEKESLLSLVKSLKIEDRVHFVGKLSRQETLETLQSCHALVHPSFHDSGGLVCLEAMAGGKPVICLDLAGPAITVSKETGIKIPSVSPTQIIDDLAEAMTALAKNESLCEEMGMAGRTRAKEYFSWEAKGKVLNEHYHNIVIATSSATR
ncbi:MAG: glycosyltransferase family 4 protein [Nitrospirales bacterium]